MALLVLAVSPLALADSHETKTYVYGTYSNCNVTGEEAADKTFEKHMKPVYEASMKSGDITGWGYLKHHSGGHWRRVAYHMGTSVPATLTAIKKMGDELDKKLNARNDDYGKACHSHDDYIWELKSGNTDEVRGKVGFSIYMVCDMSNEDRADELFDAEFAEAYNNHIGPGKLSSWGWLSHVMGGKYRRLLTMTAANVDDLINARAELLGGFQGTAAAKEFTSICGSHQDYIWDVAMEGRP